MGRDELERVRERFHACFDHEWPTGLRPDEVNYTPGVTPPDVARQLCNVWKSDQVLAATTLSERNGRWGAQLAQAPGMRLLQDNMIWKPPGSKALLAHQDAAYETFVVPQNMTTCWIALDDTHADTGTIYYARGSNHWPRSAPGGQFHAPDDWTGLPAQRGAGRVRRRRRVGADRGAGRRLRVPRRLVLARLAAERAARSRAALDHLPHGHHRHALARDQPPRDLQSLHAAGRARDGRGVLSDHVSRGRLPDALHRPRLCTCGRCRDRRRRAA